MAKPNHIAPVDPFKYPSTVVSGRAVHGSLGMEYVITGIRNGETTFTAPVEADSAEEAEEKFLNSVENPSEFEIEGADPKDQPEDQ